MFCILFIGLRCTTFHSPPKFKELVDYCVERELEPLIGYDANSHYTA